MLSTLPLRKKTRSLRRLFAIFATSLVFSFTAFSQNVVVSGAAVGNGIYPDLGSAFTAINSGSQTGSTIVVGIIGNTVEAATATLNQGTWTSLSILPSGGSARTISGSIAGPLVNFNGADRVLVDGLNSGGNSLTIDNQSTGTASTIRFISDAHVIAVQNCSILGASTSTTSGTILFSTGSVTGNDTITINSCTLDASGANFPTNGIYSAGTATTGMENSSVIISACNIANFFNPTSSTGGILVATGNTDWTIQNNRLYQNATRTYTSANTHRGIQINSGNNHVILGNTIGYANAAGTGTYTMAGTIATRFIGIDLSVGTAVATSVQGNTINGILLNTSSGAATTNGIICGINITAGNVNVGNGVPNVIGAASGVDLIKAVSTTAGAMVVAINCSSTGSVQLMNNVIGGLTSSGVTAAVSGSITGINISGVTNSLTITGNTIGNTTANNMRGGTLGLTTGSSLVFGINLPSIPNGVVTISNNTIQNFSSYGTNTSGCVRGIWTAAVAGSTTQFIINNNTITNLATNATLTTISNGQTVALGILISAGNNSTISKNTISNISMFGTQSNGCFVAGIVAANATSTTISGNQIYGITNGSTSVSTTAPGIASGIIIRSSTTSITIFNNMISLGSGSNDNTCYIGIMGNHGSTPDPVDNIYYNTVNVSGTSTGAQPSFCFLRGDLSGTARTTTVDIRNNIFTNSRTGGTGSHFAIANNYAALATSTGWPASASNNNVLNASAATVGYWGSNQTFAAWQTSSVSDASSVSGITVTYVNPANNLHLNMGVTPTPIESGAQTIALVSTDIDNDARPGPVGSVNGGAVFPDIGADEFDGVIQDIIAPTITYTPLTFTCGTGDRTFTATLTDATGLPTTGAFQPRVYFRKNALGWNSTQGVLSTGTATNGTWTFTISAAAMGGLTIGDAVSYYVIAQDLVTPTPNLRSNPGFGLVATDVNTVSTPPSTPNSYNIANTLVGTYTVGATGVYPTLTAAVNAYNTSCIGGPIIFSLIDPTYSASETFPITVLQNASASSVNTLTIKPAAATTCTITGSVSNNALIRILDNYVTIDGSNSGGPSRDLTITNTSTSGPSVVLFASTGTTPIINSALKNTIIINGAQTNTALVVSDGTTLGNAGYFNNITIQNNSIQKAFIGIYAIATVASGNGSGLLITQNDLNTAGANSIRLVGIYAQGVDGVTISNNNIANMANTADAANLSGIFIATGTVNCNITGNNITTISGTATGPVGIRFVAGVAAENSNITGNTINGLTSSVSGAGLATSGIMVSFATGGLTIDKNNISNIHNTNTGGYGSNGIQLNSSLTAANIGVYNNFISDVASYGFNAVTVDDNGYGIVLVAGGGYKIYHNSVDLTTSQVNAAGLPAAINITSGITTPASVDIRDNIFVNAQTSGSTERYAIYSGAANTVFSNIDYNDYVSAGANLGFIGSSRSNLAAIQAGFGGNANSVSIPPVFTAAPDLHLPVATNSTLQDLGQFIAAIPTDIDGQSRSTCGPDMGADEFGTPREIDLQGNAVSIVDGDATPSLTDFTDFGIQSVCNGTIAETFTILNSGTTTLSISNVSITGANASDFTVTSAPATTVAGSGSTTFTVTFDPSAAGVRSATINVNSDDCDEAIYDFAIQGTGTQVAASASAQTNVTCNGGNDGSATVATTGGVAPITYSWAPSGGTGATASGLSAGTYTCTVTDFNGCTATQSFTITEPPVLVVTATAVNGTICQGNADILNASGASTYLWNPGAMTGSTVTVFPPITTTYTVTGTSAAGCIGTATVTVIVNPTPTVTATASSSTICSGSSTTLTGNGASTYLWNPGSLSGTTVSVSPTTTTTYTVTGTNSSGCSNTASVTITVNPTPTVSISASSTTICSGSSVTLTGNGGATYNWVPGPLTGSPVTVTPTTTTTTYTMTGTSAAGCTATATITITVIPTPTVTATTVNGTICSGSSASLDATGATTYNWMPGSLNGTPVTVTPASTTTYTVTGTTSGCSSTATVTVNVNPTPTVTATTVNGTICSGSSASLDATGASSYNWMPGSLTGTPVTVTPTTTTTYTLTGTTGGCSSTATVTVVVNPTPTVTATTVNGTICSGSSASLDATGASSYNWMPGSLTGTPVTVTPTTTTTYTLTGTTGGCSSTATVTVVVNPTPTVTATTVNGTICSGSSASLDATGASSYDWMPGSLTGTPVTVAPTTTTTYTLTGTTAGCSSTATVTVVVNPTPTVTATAGSSSICNGSSTTLTGNGASTYLWNPGSLTGTTVTVTPSTTTTYTVTGTSGSGCSSTATVTVTVNTVPVVTITGANNFCAGGSTMLTATSGGTSQWYQNGVLIPGATTNTYVATTAGVYNMIKTNLSGCSDSAAVGVTVTVNPLPTVTANASSTSVCAGSSVTLTGGGATSYAWTGGVLDGVSFVPVSTSNYTVTGTDANGCSNTDNITVTVNAVPVVNLGPDVAQCSGTIILDAQNAGSTYLWSDNSTAQTLSVSTSGIYWVDVTNASGCTTRDSMTATINSNPVVALGADITQCGGTVTLDAGNAGATYLWNDNSTNQQLTVSSGGIYSVLVTLTGGCTASDTIAITINTPPTVTFALSLDTVCINGGNFTLSGESPTGGVWNGNGVSGNILDPIVAGVGTDSITYVYTDVNGCSGSSTQAIVVDLCNGLPATTFANGNIETYPNPNNGAFTVTITNVAGEGVLEITDALGQVVYSESVSTSNNTIVKQVDLGSQASGIYFVRFTTNATNTVQKVMIQR